MTDEGSFPIQFNVVTIVGVGLIGGSLGMALKERRLARQVVGLGRNQERLAQAVALGAIDHGTTDQAEAMREADLVVLCTTVGSILETVQEFLQTARPGTIVTDVGSTKSEIVRRANSPRFVGGHPMAGSERTGVEAAQPRLFQEAIWALTPNETTDPESLHHVRMLAQEVGATTLVIAPEVHDAMVAVTSHLPHVLASALMRQAADARAPYPQINRLSAGSFADLTRVSAASPELWRDVCLSNREAVLAALAHFRGQLDILETAVAEGDANEIESFFRVGANAKRDWSAL